MAKLSSTEVAIKLNISVYTLNRWYRWWGNEDVNYLNELAKKGMPSLPIPEKIGKTNWKFWNEEDIEQLEAFKNWVPHTKAGVMGSLNKKKEEK